MTPFLARPQAQRLLPPALFGVLVIMAWELTTRLAKIPPYLLPSPTLIAATLVEEAPSLLTAMWSTMQVTWIALASAVLIGSGVAMAFVLNPLVERCMLPYVILLQVTPVVAIAPLVIILTGNPQLSMVICATVVAFFPIVSNTTVGLRSVDPGLLNYFRLSKATRWETLWRLRVPSAMPYFFAGLRVSSGLALIGAVVAEFVAGTGGRSAGLAFEILQAGYEVKVPRMFAALSLVALLGIAQFSLVAWLSRRALGHWHESSAH